MIHEKEIFVKDHQSRPVLADQPMELHYLERFRPEHPEIELEEVGLSRRDGKVKCRYLFGRHPFRPKHLIGIAAGHENDLVVGRQDILQFLRYGKITKDVAAPDHAGHHENVGISTPPFRLMNRIGKVPRSDNFPLRRLPDLAW
jgi:hypothetical protein